MPEKPPQWSSHPGVAFPPPQDAPPPKPPKRFRSKLALVLASATIIVIALGFIASFILQSQVDAQLSTTLRRALNSQTFADIKFSRVGLSLLDQAVEIHDVEVRLKNSPHAISIDKVSVGGVDLATLKTLIETRKPVLPKNLRASFSGAKIPLALAGEEGQLFLTSIGVNELNISGGVTIARDPEEKTFELKDLVIDTEDIGRLNASISLSNVNVPPPEEIARIKADPKILLTEETEFSKLAFRDFSISFSDDAFVEKASQAFVAMGESSPASLVDLAIEANTPQTRDVANLAAHDFVIPALHTLKKFLEQPGSTITVASRPAKPIAVFTIFDDSTGGSINELAHKLSLTVE